MRPEIAYPPEPLSATLQKCQERAQMREAAERVARHIKLDRRATSEHATKQVGRALTFAEVP